MIKLLKRDVVQAGNAGVTITHDNVVFKITYTGKRFDAVSIIGKISAVFLKDLIPAIENKEYHTLVSSYEYNKLTAIDKSTGERVTVYGSYSRDDCACELEDLNPSYARSEDYKAFRIVEVVTSEPPCLKVYDVNTVIVMSNRTMRVL